MRALLNQSLYGTPDAAMNWAAGFTRVLVEDIGFVKVSSSPYICFFCYHPKKLLRLLVRQDGSEDVPHQVHLLGLEYMKFKKPAYWTYQID